MWHWIKRWRDWAMRELFWPFQRGGGPQLQGLHFSYEKAGILVRNEPIPWNADAVLIEALLRFPTNLARRKTDFQLRQASYQALSAVTLHRHEESNVFVLQFRLPPRHVSAPFELFWKNHLLSQAVLPQLGIDRFLDNLRIISPAIFVRVGEYTVPCQSFLASQCRGLLAGGLVTSPTSLLPLLDLDLAVEFIDHRTGEVQHIPVRLVSSQLAARQAMVMVAAQRRPRRLGLWSASWILAGQTIARNEVRIISQRAFRKSLYLAESLYVQQGKSGLSLLTRHLPAVDEHTRMGPCFRVGSREPGMAALCPLEVRAQLKGAERTPVLFSEPVLITDGPTAFMPGTIGFRDLCEVTAFELVLQGQPLGILSTSPAPVAFFTSEGGFKPTEDYAWSTAADEELSDRLSRLSEIPAE